MTDANPRTRMENGADGILRRFRYRASGSTIPANDEEHTSMPIAIAIPMAGRSLSGGRPKLTSAGPDVIIVQA